MDDFDSRMQEIKNELHQAKSQCVKDLNSKFSEAIKTAQKTFVDNQLIKHAIGGDKVTGWNNIVKECKSVSF